MKEPVFILGSHKSGTSLLRALLDGAEGLFVIPLEAHFVQYSGFWVDYALRSSRPRTLAFEEVVGNFVRHIRQSNERASQTSDSILAGRWNVSKFEAYLRKEGRLCYQPDNLRPFLDCYIDALHIGLHGAPPTAERFVEKSVENAEYATLLQKWFPDARFIHVVRNPYATLTSIRKHMTRNHYPFLGNALSALHNSYYHLYKNPRLIADYLVIRYEDLVTSTKKVMRTIADFIGIAFSERLLQPTFMGSPWGGNSTSGQPFTTISTQPLVTWQQAIHPLETSFINLLFPHVLRDYGYKRMEMNGSIYRPAPRERLMVYLANRGLWWIVRRLHFVPVL